MTDEYAENLSKAVQCSLDGKHKAAMRLFEAIATPGCGAAALMEAGFAFDRAGREDRAVAFYNRALESLESLPSGLSDKNRCDIYFCLASS